MRTMLEDARTRIARLLEVQGDDVIFTSGATEANALAILGYVRATRKRAGSDTPGRNNLHVLYLPSAHASIVENAKRLALEGVTVEPLPIKDSRVDVALLAEMIRPETVLVAMEAVCGETGVVWNTREVGEVLRKARTSDRPAIVLHVDASQAPLTEKITRDHFGAGTLVLDASKVSDVRSLGVLIAHRTIPLESLYGGGGQERGLRPGTENPEGAARFAAALESVVRSRAAFRKKSGKIRKLLAERILKDIPNVFVQEGKEQVPNILNVALVGRDTDYLVALLDEAGFAVSTKSACETDSEEGSRAVFVLTGDAERARATLRVSWGPGFSARAAARFVRALVRETAFIDKGSSE